jgi:hypothetical protein
MSANLERFRALAEAYGLPTSCSKPARMSVRYSR